jgi:hypothetical protein
MTSERLHKLQTVRIEQKQSAATAAHGNMLQRLLEKR